MTKYSSFKQRIDNLLTLQAKERMHPMVVFWMDACLHYGSSSYESRDDLPKPGALNCSIGFVLDDTKDFIRLAGETGEYGTRDITDIPKAWILRKRKLK